MKSEKAASGARVVFYIDESCAPALEFMRELKERDLAAFEQGVAMVNLLQELGHRLRRPAADILEDGIYELRWRKGKVQYRLLYFFHKQEFIVLAHGMQKEGQRVDKEDLRRAQQRRKKYVLNPKAHTLLMEIEK